VPLIFGVSLRATFSSSGYYFRADTVPAKKIWFTRSPMWELVYIQQTKTHKRNATTYTFPSFRRTLLLPVQYNVQQMLRNEEHFQCLLCPTQTAELKSFWLSNVTTSQRTFIFSFSGQLNCFCGQAWDLVRIHRRSLFLKTELVLRKSTCTLFRCIQSKTITFSKTYCVQREDRPIRGCLPQARRIRYSA